MVSMARRYHLETEKHPDGLIAKDKFFSMLRLVHLVPLVSAGFPTSFLLDMCIIIMNHIGYSINL